MQKPLAAEYRSVLAEIPWLGSSFEPADGARVLSGGEAAAFLTDPSALAGVLDVGRRLYPMDGDGADKHLAQLWWYSATGAWLRPAAAMVLIDDMAPRPSWDGASFFLRDGFWPGCTATVFDEVDADDSGDLRAYGAAVAGWLAPTVAALGELTGVRPAPLWAIAVDAVAGAATGVGNELMEPWRGVAAGHHLAAGLAAWLEAHGGPRTPAPRFADVTADSVSPCDIDAACAGEEPDWDVTAHLVRSSCCMIVHSRVADMCVSCPRRDNAAREADWMAAAG